MRRRLLAALAAVLSAALGAGLLLSYVSGADRRAMAGMETVPVLVTTSAVPSGTTGAALAAFVETRTLPRVAVAPDAVSDLGRLAGLVSTAALEPGEQVLAARFADPASLADAGTPEVPRGAQQLSVELDAQRVLGGDVAPGAKVAVFTTIDKETRRVQRSVLVTKVVTPPAPSADKPADAPAEGKVRVTLALPGDAIGDVVAGAESGGVWLSLVAPAPSPGSAPAVATTQPAVAR